MRKPKVLVIAQSPELRDRLIVSLTNTGVVELARDEPADLVCLGCAGRISRKDLDAVGSAPPAQRPPIVLFTPAGSEELAVQAFRLGVRDYLRVPFTRHELEAVVRPFVHPEHAAADWGTRIVGESRAMAEVRDYAGKVARSSSNVLITGETGTGKELVAESIHRQSARAGNPFVCINCAAIPDSLLESELFGYERGAFTGAHANYGGKLQQAHSGTVFLDEIGDMSPYAQAKLLRAIESGEIQRLGSNKPHAVDIRIVAATNRDLATDHSFRRDLYFRLNVARIHLAPLRDRREDILPLAHSFRIENNRKFERETFGFTARAQQILLRHNWPGNIRELRNAIEAAFINLDGGATAVDLPPILSDAMARQHTDASESDRMLMALYETHWNKSRAARKLNWSRMTLYRKMARYRIAEPASEIRQSRARGA